MKKFLTIFLIITTLCIATFTNSSKISYAENNIITPGIISIEEGKNPYNDPCDISFIDNNIIFLNKGSTNPDIKPHILNFSSNEPIFLGNKSYLHLCGYNNKYFYATSTEVYYYDETKKEHISINEQFTNITDLVVSSKSLFLIDNINDTKTIIYKFSNDNENALFVEYKIYNHDAGHKIRKFAYSEVSKKSFVYNGSEIIITNNNSVEKKILETNIVDMICDFEGNLYLFQTSNSQAEIILRYDYKNNYETCVTYNLQFNLAFPDKNQIISAAFIQSTGIFTLLCSYRPEELVTTNSIYTIPKDKLQAKTSKDIPDVQGLNNVKVFDTANKINNFYVAEITGYPSNRLYPVDPTTGKALDDPDKIEEIDINKNPRVIVFKEFGIYSYVLYNNKPAIVYNNSLKKIEESAPEFASAKILLNRSKVYLYPSSFVYKSDKFYDFEMEMLIKDKPVEVLKEIEINGATYCYIKYDDKYGYINKAELSESYNITSKEPKFGKIDCNGKVPLYKDKSIDSEQIILLSHKQEIQILDSGNDFYYIKVVVDGETHTGFVEAKYVLENGLTKLQIIGLWFFLSALVLGIIAIIIRMRISRKN